MAINFEWDPAKAASNLQKHGIDFYDATTVFDDPHRVAVNVTKPEHGEIRYLIVGMMSNGRMASVIYTIRNHRARIISARKVRKNEQRDYDRRQAAP